MLVPLEYLDDTEQLEYATQAILNLLDDEGGVTTVQHVADATGLDPHLIRNAAWIMPVAESREGVPKRDDSPQNLKAPGGSTQGLHNKELTRDD